MFLLLEVSFAPPTAWFQNTFNEQLLEEHAHVNANFLNSN